MISLVHWCFYDTLTYGEVSAISPWKLQHDQVKVGSLGLSPFEPGTTSCMFLLQIIAMVMGLEGDWDIHRCVHIMGRASLH